MIRVILAIVYTVQSLYITSPLLIQSPREGDSKGYISIDFFRHLHDYKGTDCLTTILLLHTVLHCNDQLDLCK